MYAGMTRNEVRGLVAVVALIAVGLGAHTYVRERERGGVWIEHPAGLPKERGEVRLIEPDAFRESFRGDGGNQG